MADLEKLKNAAADLEEGSVNGILEELMKEGGGQAKDALSALQKGMEVVGKRFEEGEYFIGDLIFSGDMLANAVKIISPALAGQSADSAGKLILCTVQGDLHDIGKNIVKIILEASGFEVLDLGIDVPPETIVQTAKDKGIGVIALSGVLTIAVESMKKTVDTLVKAGMRDKVKVLIGGAPINEQSCSYIGADAWTLNPQIGAQTCRQWLGV
jgi:methanogenic corrinoid protein MtbC1